MEIVLISGQFIRRMINVITVRMDIKACTDSVMPL